MPRGRSPSGGVPTTKTWRRCERPGRIRSQQKWNSRGSRGPRCGRVRSAPRSTRSGKRCRPISRKRECGRHIIPHGTVLLTDRCALQQARDCRPRPGKGGWDCLPPSELRQGRGERRHGSTTWASGSEDRPRRDSQIPRDVLIFSGSSSCCIGLCAHVTVLHPLSYTILPCIRICLTYSYTIHQTDRTSYCSLSILQHLNRAPSPCAIYSTMDSTFRCAFIMLRPPHAVGMSPRTLAQRACLLPSCARGP